MKKSILKKVAIIACIAAFTVTPVSAFANETVPAINANENDIMPAYSRPANYVVHNGQTIYVSNYETGQPFYIPKGAYVKLGVRFSPDHKYFKYGLVDEYNQVVFSTTHDYGLTNHTVVQTAVPSERSGYYRIFFTNLNVDAAYLSQFDIDIIFQ